MQEIPLRLIFNRLGRLFKNRKLYDLNGKFNKCIMSIHTKAKSERESVHLNI